MHAAHYSSLLPDLFRHKTTKVRVPRPQVVLLDFHGTICERQWEDKVIFPYVKRALSSYLLNNWNNDSVQNCVAGLRNESFEQRFRHKYEDAPVISDAIDGHEININELMHQVGEFVLWQMNNKKETKDTQIVERLVWQDGFKRNQITTPLYEDVMPSITSWKHQHNCLIYIISSLDADTLKLLCKYTSHGDLSHYIGGFVGSKKMGEKIISDTYKQFYESLPVARRADKKESSSSLSSRRRSGSKASTDQSRSHSLNSTDRVSSPIRTISSDGSARPILYLTDSGQEAKAAHQVNDGQVFECLLVNRPGNKRIRSYYLTQFQYIENFGDVEFVD